MAFAAGAITAGIIGGVIARAVMARRVQSQSQNPAAATRGSLSEQLAALSPLTPTPDAPFTAPAAFRCAHPLPPGVSIRMATVSSEDRRGLLALMRHVASQRGGLAREVDEVTEAYIDGMMDAIESGGIMLLAVAAAGSEAAVTATAALTGGDASASAAASFPPAAPATIIAVLKASRIGPHRCFRSVLSDCTLAVLPPFQNRKLGQHLFSSLFAHLASPPFRHVQRLELIARESNRHALGMYAKVGFNVQAKLCRRIVSGMPLHLAASSSSSSTSSAAVAVPASSASSATVASDFSLQFESDIVMVWFNPAFDLEALKDQFRCSTSSTSSSRPTISSDAAAMGTTATAAAASAAPAVAARSSVAPAAAAAGASASKATGAPEQKQHDDSVWRATHDLYTQVLQRVQAQEAAAAASDGFAFPPSQLTDTTTTGDDGSNSSQRNGAKTLFTRSKQSKDAKEEVHDPMDAASTSAAVAPASPVTSAAVASAAPVSSAVAPVTAAAVPAAAPAAAAASSDDASISASALIASGLRLQSELAQWVRLVAAGDECAPMHSATVVGDWDAMLVLNAGASGGGGEGEVAAASAEGRVKFFRLRILRCAGFYSCVTHWGLRGSLSGSSGSGSASSGGLGQTSVTSTGAGLDAAEDAFARKFYQKTGQHWKERKQFKPQEGKYCLVPLQTKQQQPANPKVQPSQPSQSKASNANAKQKK